MPFGAKSIFSDDTKDDPSHDPDKEPMSKHIGPGHKIINNSAGGKSFQMCQPCCKEVYDDDDCGAVMF